MHLTLFNQKARQEWIDTGHKFVKLSASKNIGFNDSFVLLESYSGNEDTSVHNNILQITSSEIDKIIRETTGRYVK